MDRRQVSVAISELMPRIIRGVHLDFFTHSRVTQTQFMMLLAIQSYGTCTMTQLAGNLHVSMPTATGIVTRLERMGLIRRQPGVKDRRSVHVGLTARGQAFIVHFKKAVRSRWQEVLKGLDASELKNMHGIVTKLTRYLEKGRG